jgi:hypothetical protein
MNFIRQALDDLAAAKANYWDHMDPGATIRAAYDRVIHAITADFEALHREFQHLRERIATLEENVLHVSQAPAIATDVTLKPVPAAPPPSAPLPVLEPIAPAPPAALKPAAPGAPIIGSAVAGDKQATVTFTPPLDDGGSPISGYTVSSIPAGVTASGEASPITLMDLVNKIAYRFIVTAHNEIGASAPSEISNVVTPMTPEDRQLAQEAIDAGVKADEAARVAADAAYQQKLADQAQADAQAAADVQAKRDAAAAAAALSAGAAASGDAPPPAPTIDPESGIDYAQFKDDAFLTEAQAFAKLANAVDPRDGRTPAPVVGGFGFGMVGSNPPWNGTKASGGKGWSWDFYKSPAVNGYQGFPDGHPVDGAISSRP